MFQDEDVGDSSRLLKTDEEMLVWAFQEPLGVKRFWHRRAASRRCDSSRVR